MWTEERVSTLRKLWAEGLSASEIAKQLGGVTRNAVIGKVHRLGLVGRASPSRPARSLKALRPRAVRVTAQRYRPPTPPKPKPEAPKRVIAQNDPCSLAAAALLGAADTAQRRRDGMRGRKL